MTERTRLLGAAAKTGDAAALSDRLAALAEGLEQTHATLADVVGRAGRATA